MSSLSDSTSLKTYQDRNGPLTFVLISGDNDFTKVVSGLRSKGHAVVLITPNGRTSAQLKAAASKSLSWREVTERAAAISTPRQATAVSRTVVTDML